MSEYVELDEEKGKVSGVAAKFSAAATKQSATTAFKFSTKLRATKFGATWRDRGSVIEENPYLANLDKDQLNELQSQFDLRAKRDGDADEAYIITPESPYFWVLRTWDALMLVLLLNASAFTPYRIAFGVPAEGVEWVLEALVPVLFGFDMALTFFRAIDRPDGLIKSPAKIRTTYLKGWFIIDLLSSIPVDLLDLWLWTEPDDATTQEDLAYAMRHCDEGSTNHFIFGCSGALVLTAELRVLRLLRLVRLVRLFKLDDYVNALESSFNWNLAWIKLLAVLIKLFVGAHFLACIFFFVGNQKEWIATSWVSQYRGGLLVKEDDPMGPVDQYMIALWWSLGMLTGLMSDVYPQNSPDRCVTYAAQLLGAFVFAYVLDTVSKLTSSIGTDEINIALRMQEVKTYLGYRDVPRELQMKIRSHFDRYYRHAASMEQERQIFEQLPETLRVRTQAHVFGDTCQKITLLSSLAPYTHAAFFSVLHRQSVTTGEEIYHRGEIAHKLYFVTSSQQHEALRAVVEKLEVIGMSANTNLPKPEDATGPEARFRHVPEAFVASLYDDSSFGEDIFLGKPRRIFTTIALAPCEVCYVEKDDLIDIFLQFPYEGKRMIRDLVRLLKASHFRVAEGLTCALKVRIQRGERQLAKLRREVVSLEEEEESAGEAQRLGGLVEAYMETLGAMKLQYHWIRKVGVRKERERLENIQALLVKDEEDDEYDVKMKDLLDKLTSSADDAAASTLSSLDITTQDLPTLLENLQKLATQVQKVHGTPRGTPRGGAAAPSAAPVRLSNPLGPAPTGAAARSEPTASNRGMFAVRKPPTGPSSSVA